MSFKSEDGRFHATTGVHLTQDFYTDVLPPRDWHGGGEYKECP